MHTLHVKIDNQAFLLIHVVEQVQPFKRERLILIISPSESEIVRGEKVVPMRPTILTRLVNSEVARIEKNVRNSRLEAMEKSGVPCVGMCRRPPRAISVRSQFFGGCTRKVLNQITRSRSENIHADKCEVVKACSRT